MQTHEGPVDAVEFINQLDKTTELKIPKKGILKVRTKNSLYEFNLSEGKVRGGIVGPEWKKGRVNGVTFGGSMIMIDRILQGAYLEFYVEGLGLKSTTAIQMATLEEPKEEEKNED